MSGVSFTSPDIPDVSKSCAITPICVGALSSPKLATKSLNLNFLTLTAFISSH